MNQSDILRRDCKAFIERYGTRQKYFCDKLKISRTTISLFLKGSRELGIERQRLLREIIDGEYKQ
jgi:transcriptional regulator with XRE-family HTH domain